jgi:hypothetical protein
MTGKEKSKSTPEGLNTLSVRQSSDIFGRNCCARVIFNTRRDERNEDIYRL